MFSISVLALRLVVCISLRSRHWNSDGVKLRVLSSRRALFTVIIYEEAPDMIAKEPKGVDIIKLSCIILVSQGMQDFWSFSISRSSVFWWLRMRPN